MLGENIRDIRQKKGWTQDELAERLHVVRQTVSKWEKNLSVPDVQSLQRLAEVLDTSVEILLGIGPDQTPTSEQQEIAAQLAQIHQQLAEKNRQTDRVLGWVSGFGKWLLRAIGILAVVLVLLMVSSLLMFGLDGGTTGYEQISTQNVESVGE